MQNIKPSTFVDASRSAVVILPINISYYCFQRLLKTTGLTDADFIINLINYDGMFQYYSSNIYIVRFHHYTHVLYFCKIMDGTPFEDGYLSARPIEADTRLVSFLFFIFLIFMFL